MGLLVCCVIFAVGYRVRSPLIVPLVASLAFGSTAALALSSLGGSTPLIYTMFSALLIAVVVARRRIFKDLGVILARLPDMWVLLLLMLYAGVGSVLLPRLFAGQTTAFTKPSGSLMIVETSLAPVSGNITQTGYLVLNGLTGIALCIYLLKSPSWDQVRRGFTWLVALTAGFAVLDLAAKFAGAGDLLAPIRTANYALLTESSEGSFYRIVGAFPEASSFATAALACLAYAFTYWHRTGDRLMLWLWMLLLALLTLSTSSTAYVGLSALLIVAALGVGGSVMSNRITGRELVVVALLLASVLVGLAIALYREGFFDPLFSLLEDMVLDKSTSDSGRERGYWNAKSMQAFYDTYGLGIGVGSSRASSWPIAVLSQLGVIGTLLMAKLAMVFFVSLKRVGVVLGPETEAIVASVRASALATLMAASLISGTPDPGTLFFIAFAVVLAARAQVRAASRRAPVAAYA